MRDALIRAARHLQTGESACIKRILGEGSLAESGLLKSTSLSKRWIFAAKVNKRKQKKHIEATKTFDGQANRAYACAALCAARKNFNA